MTNSQLRKVEKCSKRSFTTKSILINKLKAVAKIRFYVKNASQLVRPFETYDVTVKRHWVKLIAYLQGELKIRTGQGKTTSTNGTEIIKIIIINNINY